MINNDRRSTRGHSGASGDVRDAKSQWKSFENPYVTPCMTTYRPPAGIGENLDLHEILRILFSDFPRCYGALNSIYIIRNDRSGVRIEEFWWRGPKVPLGVVDFWWKPTKSPNASKCIEIQWKSLIFAKFSFFGKFSGTAALFSEPGRTIPL